MEYILITIGIVLGLAVVAFVVLRILAWRESRAAARALAALRCAIPPGTKLEGIRGADGAIRKFVRERGKEA